MGAVYLARETALEREVAIKVLPPERAATPESRERFRREARTAAKLAHPNIVPLHTFGEASGVMYFVMGYVRGESVAARMQREGRLPGEDALRILAEIADALDCAHGQGVVHRDVKPDNVLIDGESGRAMLTDFGVAKAPGGGQTLTAAGSVLGTPRYMSPEQASGKETVDSRSDIYSLGVMGYAMLAGRLPFEGTSAGEILVQHVTKEPPPLGPQVRGVPEAAIAAVMRCLAKDPAQRWPDAKGLGDALRRAGAGDDLPEALEPLDAFGFRLVTGSTVIALLLWIWSWWPWRPPWQTPGELMFGNETETTAWVGLLLIVSLMFVSKSRPARAQGFTWGSILRVAFHEPRRWRWWYPSALRRPGGEAVWRRLPPLVRWLRTTTLAWVLFGGLVHLPFVLFVHSPAATSELREIVHGPAQGGTRTALQALGPILWPIPVVLLTQLLQVALCHAQLRRRGLNESDRAKVMAGEPVSRRSFWEKPHIAAILGPREAAGGPPSFSSTAEYLRAILRLADGLTGPARKAAEEAAAAARKLAASLDALDGAITALARDADPDEAARLEEKVAGLGFGATEEGDGRRQMRDLLRQQLDLVRGLAARLGELRRARARRLEWLQTLWKHVDGLSRPASDEMDLRERAARVRALCGQVEREVRPPDGEPTATAVRSGPPEP
jgi:hypothetical protein